MSQIIKPENEVDLINKVYTFQIESFSIKYTIKIHLDESDNILISIMTKNQLNKDFIYENKLNFENLEIYAHEFFSSFKGNIRLFYKFLLRLFNAKLIRVQKSNDYDLILILICLINNEKKEIEIFFHNFNNFEEDKIKNGYNQNKNNIIVTSSKKNTFPDPYIFYYINSNYKKYTLQMSKNEYPIKDSVYKEIIFNLIDEGDKRKAQYSCYLDIFDFLSLSEPYYKLFNYSIEDIYEDFAIIFSNNNYHIEINENKKNCIKLYYAIFNLISFDYKYPYYFNYIELKNEKREDEQLLLKIDKFFTKLELIKLEDKEKLKEVIENNFDKINDKSSEKKKDIKENIINKNNKECEFDKKINFSQKYNENYKSNQYFNNLFNSKKKRKDNKNSLLGHKIKYKDTNIYSYFKAKNDEKKGKKTSKKENNGFKLTKKLKYNVDIESIYKNYENIFYQHPLDNDNEYKFLSSDNEGYHLCKICNKCFKSKYKVRKHQWKDHLMPFGDIIRKELKNKGGQ